MKTIGKKFILPMLCLIIAFSFSACSPKCAVEGCKNPAIDGHEYCEEHTCAVDGCYECVKSGSTYCEKHGCAIDSCPNLSVEGGNFCAIHTCAVEGCYNQVKSGSTYCEKHGCAVFDCPNLPIDGSKFCTEHTCTVNKCYEQVKDGSAYCEKHGCAKAGCPNPHINGGRFCKEHTCKMKGCTEVGIYTDGQCEKHHPKDIKEVSKTADSDLTSDNNTVSIEIPKDKKIVDSNGKQVWKVYTISDSIHFSGTFKGSGNFVIKLLNSNQELENLVCNTIGDYVVDKTVDVTSGVYYYIETSTTEGYYEYSWTGTIGE